MYSASTRILIVNFFSARTWKIKKMVLLFWKVIFIDQHPTHLTLLYPAAAATFRPGQRALLVKICHQTTARCTQPFESIGIAGAWAAADEAYDNIKLIRNYT
jgi:hypothetical protein